MFKSMYRISAFFIIVAIILSFVQVNTGLAISATDFVRQVRVLGSDETGVLNPGGIAFSQQGNSFYLLEAEGIGQPFLGYTNLSEVSPLGEQTRALRIAAAIPDPINMVFDGRAGYLLALQANGNQLLKVRNDNEGRLVPKAIEQNDVRRYGLQDPQGMTMDEENGILYILDAAVPRILRIVPGIGGSISGGRISTIDLPWAGSEKFRGIAYDPTNSHLHVFSPQDEKLYELTTNGRLVASRDLREFGLTDPQGMVFAPSGDQTDDPEQMSLYIADSGLEEAQVTHVAHLAMQAMVPLQPDEGQVVELSFVELAAAAQASFTSSLVNTVDTSLWSPPSPDPSGLAYIGSSNHLLVSDGEVEETKSGITHFEGANVWETTLQGDVLSTGNTSSVPPNNFLDFSNEPTGVAWNPANGHYFFVTDSNPKDITELAPGGDGLFFTPDDIITSFPLISQNADGEGLAFDSWNNHFFVADGVNMEIYEYDYSGAYIGQFDVQQYGVADPESVEFNPFSGTLFVLSSNHSSLIIIETTTSGDLLQTFDISATDALAAAGLAYAPASDGSGAWRFYIVDRAIDNNPQPTENDGKMYEMTAPAPSGDTPPTVTLTNPTEGATLSGTINVTANANDDNGVTQVEFFVDGSSIGVDMVAPYSVSWNTTGVADGSHTVLAEATDTVGQLRSDANNVTVDNVNDPPVANDDPGFTTNTSTPLFVTAPGVLANDTDIDNDPLIVSAVNGVPANVGTAITLASGASLILNADGSFSYTPYGGFTGLDSFSYFANDGNSDSLTPATVTINVGASMVDVKVAVSSDDAEECLSDHSIYFNSSDLELVRDDNAGGGSQCVGDQIVGIRFNNVSIPQGVTISNAYIQFKVDETSLDATALTIQAEAVDNAAPFSSAVNSISSKSPTTAAVSWSPPTWPTVGVAGPDQQTSNIATVVQEIVSRPGWASGNSLNIIISGSGQRVAESYDGDQAGAPLLHVEFSNASPVNHTVTFNANGGSGTMSDQVANVPTTLTLNAFTFTGYNFAGWNTAANGSGTAYSDGATYDFSADVTLFAQWSVLNHTVTFNANGGTGTMEPQVSNVSAALNLNAFTFTGYNFAGWNTAANGSGTAYADGATYDFSADVTLFAQWSALPNHTVTFNANGGSGTMSDQVANVPTALTLNAFTFTGYTFAGWNTAANGSGTAYADGATYDFSADVTLFAQWSALPNHTVTFNANGGSGTMSDQVANVPTALTLNAFTFTGYNFAGWNTAANGSGTAYADGATYDFSADVTLFAQWSALTYTLDYAAGPGGTLSGNTSQLVTYGADGTPVTAIPDTDYHFVEWSDGVLTAERTDTNVMVDINVTANFAIDYIDSLASSETLIAGTVNGDYTDTRVDGGNAESITEIQSGGKPSARYNYLEHKWNFNVTSGNVVTLFANVWSSGSSDGDSFIFAYSTDDVNYVDMFKVNNTNADILSYVLPTSTQGTVYVRVIDSNHFADNQILNLLDTIYIDHMYIRSETMPGSPPAAPTGLSATAISTGQIDLSWTDIATDEEGFYIQRSEDNSNWSLIDTVGADVTAYSDLTVFPSTTYYYRVQAYNFSGASAYTNTASATTPAGMIFLDGSGSKVKGVLTVNLWWDGSSAPSFDIYRNGNYLTTVTGTTFTDIVGSIGTYEYQVCETGSTVNCSNLLLIVF